jgi:hypothetical protein
LAEGEVVRHFSGEAGSRLLSTVRLPLLQLTFIDRKIQTKTQKKKATIIK